MDRSLESIAGGRGIDYCSRQISFSLIIESKLSKSTQMSESRNSSKQLITKSVDHANSGFLKLNQHFEKKNQRIGPQTVHSWKIINTWVNR